MSNLRLIFGLVDSRENWMLLNISGLQEGVDSREKENGLYWGGGGHDEWGNREGWPAQTAGSTS